MLRLASSSRIDKSSLDNFIASSSRSMLRTLGLALSMMTFIYTFVDFIEL